jgi:phosphoadenosine phosphosulfate reductase
VKEKFEGYKRWDEFLKEYAKGNKIADKWHTYGLWRWRKPPKELINLLNLNDKESTITPTVSGTLPKPAGRTIEPDKMDDNTEVYSIGKYHFISAGGYDDCKGTISLEGIFNFPYDFERVCAILNILGETIIDEDTNSCSINDHATLFDNGSLSVRGKNKKQIERILKEVHKILIRANDCVECGICIARCNTGALQIKNVALDLDVDLCNHCGDCLGPCTVIDFEKDENLEL